MEIREPLVGYQRLVVAVGYHNAFLAEQEICSCAACDELASIPFGSLVLLMAGYDPTVSACILPELNQCPRCRESITESTPVRLAALWSATEESDSSSQKS